MKKFVDPFNNYPLIKKKDFFFNPRNIRKFHIKDSITIFAKESYVNSFGDQWNNFRKLQLDSYNKFSDSENRLKRCARFDLALIKSKNILEAGCGAGRFTEIFLKYGANVHSFDLSSAVFANFITAKDAGANENNYSICMADINHIPFQNESFEFVFCLGVLQHTPNTYDSLESLSKKLKKNGILVIDHYCHSVGNFTSLYLVWWFIIKRLKPIHQKKLCDILVNLFFPIHWIFRKNRILSILLRRISPIHFKYPDLDNSYKTLFNISRLVTHDRNTDYYKRHISLKTLVNYLEKLGFKINSAEYCGIGIEISAVKIKEI